jgi:hypothetical protein
MSVADLLQSIRVMFSWRVRSPAPQASEACMRIVASKVLTLLAIYPRHLSRWLLRVQAKA